MSLPKQFLKNLRKFRLVTFDVTDTLLRFRRSPATQYAETAASHGYPDVNEKILSQTFREELSAMIEKYPIYGRNTPNMDWCEWWIQVVLRTFKSMNAGIPDDVVLKIAKELVRIYHTNKCWVCVDGANEIVLKMKQARKKVGVISNFDSSLPQILNNMALNKFDFILTAYDVGVLKPNKEIFDLALKEANVKSDQALHIGNMYDLDYFGAINAGWSSILISEMSREEMEQKNINSAHVYRSLTKLLHALEHRELQWHEQGKENLLY